MRGLSRAGISEPTATTSSSGPLEVLLLVEQIRPRRSQVDNLGTPVAVALERHALGAVARVADALAAAHDAFVRVVAERALVADPNLVPRPHVRVAHRAFAVAFVA